MTRDGQWVARPSAEADGHYYLSAVQQDENRVQAVSWWCFLGFKIR